MNYSPQPYLYAGPPVQTPPACSARMPHDNVSNFIFHCNLIILTFFFFLTFFQPEDPPTFEKLTKNRILCERRFYINNSNSKWLLMGVIPATNILDETAEGFYVEVLLCGDKHAPIPLGGVEGIAAVIKGFRDRATLLKIVVQNPVYTGPISEHIAVSKANFGADVSSFGS